jgi:hypothetical protein
MIDSFATTTLLEAGNDRAAKSTFTIKVNGYMIPDTVNKDMATARSKFYTKSQVVFTMETAGNIETLSTSGTPKTAMGAAVGVADSYNVNVTQINTVDTTTLTYLNTNKQLTGTFIDNVTMTFSSGWLTAPANLPATSVDNFTFFCNGQFIEKTAIVSFTQSSGVSTLVINPSALSFSFSSTDEVIAIGKFA